MTIILAVEQGKLERVREIVSSTVPSCAITTKYNTESWPEMTLDFSWRDLDAVVAAIHKAFEHPVL